MFPEFSIPFLDIKIYTFGLALVISFGCFWYMLHKLAKKTGLNQNFFLGNALIFVLSTFLFSRLFFVLAEWRDYKYIVSDRLLNFFIMTDYNLSFIGGVLGFLLVLFYKIRRFQQPKEKYIDVVVLSFLFAGVIGYLGAFFGGQIYGRPTDLPIGIIYHAELSNIPFTSAILPLALFYSLGTFLLFSALYIAREMIKIDGFIGYFGAALFCLMIFVGEFFSGTEDILRLSSALNLTQVGALLGLGICIKWFWTLSRKVD